MDEQQNNDISPQISEFMAEYNEKQRIHRTAWAVAVPLCVLFLISNTLRYILAFFGTRLGYSAQQISDFFSDPATTQLLEIVFSVITMTVPFIIAAKIAGYNISQSGGFNRARKGTVLPHLLFGVGFCAFANIAVTAAGDLLNRFGVERSYSSSEKPEGIFGFALIVISTAVVPALVEEFAFRGILLGLLRPYGEGFAIITTSVAFGLVHINIEQKIFACLVGLALGFIRVKSGSIIVCMAVHAINNLIAVFVSHIRDITGPMAGLIYTLYIMAALIAAVLGMMLLKYKGEFSFPAQKRTVSAGKTYFYYIFSPATVIFLCMILCHAVLKISNQI